MGAVVGMTKDGCEQIARSLLALSEKVNREGDPERALRLIASAERWFEDARRKGC